jgi:hypothetical protein
MKDTLCIGKRCAGVRRTLSCIDAVNARFCGNCYKRVESEVRDLPRIYDDLLHVMLPSPRLPLLHIKGTRDASGISINEHASSGRSEVIGFLRSWSALVADECSMPIPAGHDCDSLAIFLLRHLDWLLAHPAAGDFDEEVHALTLHVRRIADSASMQFDIGPCVRPGCGARLSAEQSASTGQYEVRCGAGHAWQANQWLQLYWLLQGKQ